jgi:NAD-dependent DNA ligase
MEEVLCKKEIILIHAHSHRFRDTQIGKSRVICIKALDPDKCIGSPPCITVFDIDKDNFSFTEKCFSSPKEEVKDNKLAGITVCITGRLKAFTNRGALVEIITSHEGKVVDRMSQTVEVLINNDIASESAKNKYAKEHGIPILTEEEFKEKYLDF